MAATKTTVTKTTKTGKVTKTKDTGKLSGRQQLKSQKMSGKKELSKNATNLAAVTDVAASTTGSLVNAQQEKTKREQARQKTYQEAIAKWNGILPSTPETDTDSAPLEGSQGGSNNSTGTNPGFING